MFGDVSGGNDDCLLADHFLHLFHVGKGLMPEIGVVQLCVMAVLFQQSIVAAFLDDRPLLHDHDAVRGLDRG